MKDMTPKALFAAVLVALAFVSTGCTSPAAYRQAMEDKDAEIRTLREERTKLKRDRQEDLAKIGDLESRLLEANAKLLEADRVRPEPASAQVSSFPELDDLGIGYGLRNGQMVISIPSAISFPSGSAKLSADGRSALAAVARRLQGEYPGAAYFIEGHTDSDPIKKSGFESNRELSIARAMAVLTYLVEECRVSDEQCVVVGHGQYAPVASNGSAQEKARNRRVEIVVQQGPAR